METHEGQILRDWLDKHRLSAKELADKLGISDQAIYAQIRKEVIADSFKHKLSKANLNIFQEDYSLLLLRN